MHRIHGLRQMPSAMLTMFSLAYLNASSIRLLILLEKACWHRGNYFPECLLDCLESNCFGHPLFLVRWLFLTICLCAMIACLAFVLGLLHFACMQLCLISHMHIPRNGRSSGGSTKSLAQLAATVVCNFKQASIPKTRMQELKAAF